MKFVRKLTALFVAAAMLFGCGSSSSGKASDTFRFASELDILSMDSTVADDGMSFNAMHCITEGLMSIGSDGSVVPGLAESYEVSEDQLTYTFHLRDAKWSNDDPVTANDFVFAWRRIIQNAGNYAYMMTSEGANVKNADGLCEKGTAATDKDMETLGVKAVDDKTLVVELESPVPFFVDLMTFPCYYPQNQKFVEEKGKDYATTAENTISCGAYTMTAWTNGKSATFTKNPNFYDADSVKTQTIEFNLVMDPQSAASNFDAGELDYATITSALVDNYQGQDVLKSFNEGYLFYLEVNFKNKYLANANIRKAISLAINRTDLCDTILKDGSKEANGFVPRELSFSSANKDYRDDTEDYTAYDLKAAQEALDAGLKELGESEAKVQLLYGTDEDPMKDFAEYLQGCFSQLKGLSIEMVATVKQDRIYNREANGNFDLACTRWGPDYSDPTTYLNLCASANTNNYGKYASAEYDALMKKIQTEADVDTRWQYMIDAEKIAMQDYAKIPVFEKGGSALQAKGVNGLVHKAVGVPYTFAYVEVK